MSFASDPSQSHAHPTPPTDAASPRRDPCERFTDRADIYARYRPGYPDAAVDFIVERTGIRPGSTVVDVGCGTGISSAIWLARRMRVIGIEPNAAMRAQAASRLAGYDGFTLVDASAEQARLPAASADLVQCAQAFHWFDRGRAHAEFARILRPPKWVVLMWNDRPDDGSTVSRRYEAIMRAHGTDYQSVDHRNILPEQIATFLGSAVETFQTDNTLRLDEEALIGRATSSSYTPRPGSAGLAAMVADLRALFAEEQQGGTISWPLWTRVYLARLG